MVALVQRCALLSMALWAETLGRRAKADVHSASELARQSDTEQISNRPLDGTVRWLHGAQYICIEKMNSWKKHTDEFCLIDFESAMDMSKTSMEKINDAPRVGEMDQCAAIDMPGRMKVCGIKGEKYQRISYSGRAAVPKACFALSINPAPGIIEVDVWEAAKDYQACKAIMALPLEVQDKLTEPEMTIPITASEKRKSGTTEIMEAHAKPAQGWNVPPGVSHMDSGDDVEDDAVLDELSVPGKRQTTSETGKFELFRGKNGEDIYWRLLGHYHQIILVSEAYTSKAGALNGIRSVKKNAQNMENFHKRSTPEPSKDPTSSSSQGKPYFILKAANGATIGTSEMYESSSGRDAGIDSVQRWAREASIKDLVERKKLMGKFEVYKDSSGQLSYFRLRASNGQIVLVSKPYATKELAMSAIESVIASAPNEANWEDREGDFGAPYFRLKDENGDVVGISEKYSTAASRDHGKVLAKRWIGNAAIVDLIGTEEPAAEALLEEETEEKISKHDAAAMQG